MKRPLSVLGWTAVALLGAAALGAIALTRGEPVNGLWFVVAAASSYLIAYRFYSGFLAARVLALDDTRATPAERLDDGRDFVPTNRWVAIGHHFAAIAGPGPLVGPTLAADDAYRCRLADDIGADQAEEAIFGTRFEVRAGDGDEHAAVGDDIFAASHFQGPIDELLVVGLAHVGEAWTQYIVVRTDQGIDAHEVDVVRDDEDIAGLKIGVQPSSRVGKDRDFHAERPHHSHGQGDLLKGIAFIKVVSPFEGYHWPSSQLAQNEASLMRCDSRLREVRDLRIGEAGFDINLAAQPRQPSAQGDPKAGLELRP